MPSTLTAPETPLRAPVTASHYNVVSIPITRRKAMLAALFGTPSKHEFAILGRCFASTLRFVRGYWANLMLATCLFLFAGIAAFAMSVQDNYSCTPGEHVVAPGDSVYHVVSRYCSGNRMAAQHDIIKLNNGEAILHPGDVLVIPTG